MHRSARFLRQTGEPVYCTGSQDRVFMLSSRGLIKRKRMASNRLNDSLENGVYPTNTPSAAPEDVDRKTKPTDGSVYLGLLTYGDFCLLQDKASGKNRALGVTKLQEAVDTVSSVTVLESNLGTLMDDACAAVSDSHIKVTLAGLQLLEPLIRRTGSSLTPYLPSLVEAVLAKMGTNKHVLKKAGMKVLVQLMHYSRPQEVTKEIANFGLKHKQSKVREESLNAITAALIRFPKSEFQLIPLAKEIMPTLSDAKPRVRQACMECAAKMASLCDERDFRHVVSLAAKNGRRTDEQHVVDTSMAILQALQCRIVRECPPLLKDDGLVKYGMPVIGVDIPLAEHGPDVDWIRDGGLSRSRTMPPNSLDGSGVRKENKFRPFRSASKRLPWEQEDQVEEGSTADKTEGVGHPIASNNEGGDINATYTLARSPPPDSTPLTHQLPSSSKIFAKDDSNSPPTHRPPTGRKRLGLSYTGIETGARTTVPQSNPSPTGSGSTSLVRELHDMVPTKRGSLPPPIPPPGSSFGRRHSTLPNGVVARDLPMRNGLRKNTGFGSASPQLSPIGSATTTSKAVHTLDSSLPQPQNTTVEEFSVSWPRSRVGARSLGERTRRASEQITADPIKAVGGVQDGVRTTVLRPPSKPRVRNPITLMQLQEEKRLKTTLLQQQQQLQDSPQDSQTLTEKEFLMCNNTTLTGGGEDEYYSMVPEDNTVLDNSLSSSLSSLYRSAQGVEGVKNAENDSLRLIREKAASRKAQLLSAECSTSNSPEFEEKLPRKERSQQRRQQREPTTITEAARKKSKLDAGKVGMDFNKTFTAGDSLAHLDPSCITWQNLQSLTQTAPATVTSAPAGYPAEHRTRRRKKMSKVGGSDEDERSSDAIDGGSDRGDVVTFNGRSLDRQREHRSEPPPPTNREHRPKPKSKKMLEGSLPPTSRAGVRRAASLGPEGQRPSIERGGTNMIVMEVNGVKSPAPLAEQPVNVVRGMEGRGRKQRKSEPAFSIHKDTEALSGPPPTFSSAPSKPPLPPTATFGVGGGLGGEGRASVLPELSGPQRKKHSKYTVGRAKDESPVGQFDGRRRNSLDGATAQEGGGGGENKSPGGSKSSIAELQPFLNPDRGLREALDGLSSSDWNEKCDGIMGVRRLTMFHVERLIPELHTVVLAIVQEVKNLRSSVSRAAISCLGDFFIYTGRSMDPELDKVVRVLLQKTGESSGFIREDVERTLCEMVQHATPGKVLLSIITGGLNHRNIHVRGTTSQFMGQAVERYGAQQLLHAPRDLLEKTLTATLSFMGDAAAEPRYYGRKCLSHLLTAADFERVASRTLTSQQWSKLRDAIETLRVKGVGEPPSEAAAAAHSRNPTGGTVRESSHVRSTGGGRTVVDDGEAKPRNSRRVTHAAHSGEHPPLPDRLVERLKASGWEDRQEAISDLEQFVDAHPRALGPHMLKVFDAFNPRLTDRNSKVNLLALEAFSNMVPLLGNLLVPLSANIIKALMPNLASKNATIHSAAMTVFHLLTQCIDPMCLIQPIATHSQHGNARVQPIMISKLAELAKVVYGQNAKLVTRQVLPVMWHLLAGKPPGSTNAKAAVVSLCETLFNTMGQSFLDSAASLPPQSQQRLDQILQSRTFS